MKTQEASEVATQVLSRRPAAEISQPRLQEIPGGTVNDIVSELLDWRRETVDYINSGNPVDMVAYIHDIGSMVGYLAQSVHFLVSDLNEVFSALK